MMNDKVSEEVRELVYSDYNNKYEQLKSELKEIEKGCKKRITYQDISTKCGEEIGDIGITFKVYCPTCQAKIEYLKKGISACEEILNSQQIQKDNSEGSNTDYLETQSTTEEVKKHEFKSGCVDNQSADTPTLIKQALSQRNQEILDKIEKLDGYIYCMVKNKDYLIVKKVKGGDFVKREELKQQLNQPKEEDFK
jgi:hypothetical protein